MKLGQPFQAFNRWLGQFQLAKPAPTSKAGQTNTNTISGGKKVKRAPRLKDEVEVGTQRTKAKAEMEYFKRAEDRALNPVKPRRDTLMALYSQITKDNYLTGQMTTLKNKVLSEGFTVIDKEGNEKPEVLELFERPWFTDFLARVLDTDFYGHTLINFDYPNDQGEFHRFDLIPRGQVVPEFGQVLLKPTDDVGIPFRGIDADYTKLLIEVRLFNEEGKDHLGILCKAAPEVIWKRYSRADFSRRSEKFGMPLVSLKTSAVEEDELAKREASLANMGANGWMLIDDSEELEVVESSNQDGSKMYVALSDQCNNEIAYLISGQTMTSQDGASKSQGEVHERVQEHYIQARMRFLSQYVNYELWPFLQLWGYPLEGLKFSWRKWIDEANAKQAALEAIKNGDTGGGKPKPTGDPKKDTPTPPNTEGREKKGRRATMSTPSFSVAGSLGGEPAKAENLTLASADTNLLKVFTDVIKKLHTEKPGVKKMLKSPEFLALYRATATELSQGLEDGYGQKIAAVKWNSPDGILLAKLTESLYVFSANKDYQLLTELNGLLLDGGTVRNYASFEAEALKLHEDYNRNWLQTEYETAIATGQMAAKWVGFQEDKDKYFLRYSTANDDRVRPTHAELDGIMLPVDHAFWNTHYPPLGWKCRCNVVRVPRNGKTATEQSAVDSISAKVPDFGHNAGKTGVVFPDSHQYNNVPDGVAPLLRKTASQDAPKPKKPNE